MGSPTHDGNHIYQSVDLKPGQIQEVIIKNNDPHSILTWDFDVVRSNLKFSVYRTSKAILSTVSGECYSQRMKILSLKFGSMKSLLNLNVFSRFISTDKSSSILDSDDFELEKDYFRVEPTLDCHQKESVQVSNILSQLFMAQMKFIFFAIKFTFLIILIGIPRNGSQWVLRTAMDLPIHM